MSRLYSITMLIFTTDKARLLHHFQKDPVLFSYHIGDLDDSYFNDCQWAVDYHERARIEEAVLIYTGCQIPAVLAFGLSDRFPALLEQIVDILPPRFYCHFHPYERKIFKRYFIEHSLGTFIKMKYENVSKTLAGADNKIKKLDMSYRDKLIELYQKSYPENYFTEKMLLTGKYYGYLEKGKILSAAGVHVYSDDYKIAVLGNIVTDLNHRGKGLSSLVTSRLVTELANENKQICLNVKKDNLPAIQVYKKLGFIEKHEYEESLFELK